MTGEHVVIDLLVEGMVTLSAAGGRPLTTGCGGGPSGGDMSDVVVVGAGVAGLACAARLHAAGVPVRVLEASDGDEPWVRDRLTEIYGDTSSWRHVATYPIEAALPAMLPPLPLRKPVRLRRGLYVCGDHRDTGSTQGALVSGRRAAQAVTADLSP